MCHIDLLFLRIVSIDERMDLFCELEDTFLADSFLLFLILVLPEQANKELISLFLKLID